MRPAKFERGRDESDPDPEPEIDREARDRLVRDVTTGAAGAVFGTRVREDVAERVGVLALEELFSGLEPPQEASAAEFLTAPLRAGPGRPESFSWRMWRPGTAPRSEPRRRSGGRPRRACADRRHRLIPLDRRSVGSPT